jgi:hypothetical protein
VFLVVRFGEFEKEVFVRMASRLNKAALSPMTSQHFDISSTKKIQSNAWISSSLGELLMSCSGTTKSAIIPNNAPLGVINQALLAYLRTRY